MQVYMPKEVVKRMFPYLQEYEYKKALNKLLNTETVREHVEDFTLQIPAERLRQQIFQETIWYQSTDSSFGVFKQEDNRWRLIMQRR